MALENGGFGLTNGADTKYPEGAANVFPLSNVIMVVEGRVAVAVVIDMWGLL